MNLIRYRPHPWTVGLWVALAALVLLGMACTPRQYVQKRMDIPPHRSQPKFDPSK